MAIAKFAQVGDKLSDVQGKLDGIADLFENPLESLTDSLLGGFEFPGGELPGAIGGLIGSIPSFPGLNLGFGGLGGFGDCLRNLDDLIVEMLKEKIIELTLSIPAGLAAAALMSTIASVIEVIQEVIDTIISLSQESLMDLLIRVQNATGFLQRITAIKTMTDLYGEIICNLNALIDKILDFDPCNLLDEIAGTGPPPGPKPVKVPEADVAMPAFPATVKTGAPNVSMQATRAAAARARNRIGTALRKRNAPEGAAPYVETESHRAALTTLQQFVHGFRGQILSLGRPGGGSQALSNIRAAQEKIVREKATEWSEDAMNFFVDRFNNLLAPALEDSAPALENDIILQWHDNGTAAAARFGATDASFGEPAEQKCEPKEGEAPPPASTRSDGLTPVPAPEDISYTYETYDLDDDGYPAWDKSDLPFLKEFPGIYADEIEALENGASTAAYQPRYGPDSNQPLFGF